MLQPTKFQHVQTDSVSDASRLLDLDGLAVDRVESDAFGGRVVHVVTADETASACPRMLADLGSCVSSSSPDYAGTLVLQESCFEYCQRISKMNISNESKDIEVLHPAFDLFIPPAAREMRAH